MSFFMVIGGPWIVLMVLDLFWTRQGMEPEPTGARQNLLERANHLLQRRDPPTRPTRARGRGPGDPAAAGSL